MLSGNLLVTNRTYRYSSLEANYLTIPVYTLGAISLLIQVYFSDRLKRRGVFIIGCCVPVAVGYLVCVGSSLPGAGYAGMFILVIGKKVQESFTAVSPDLIHECKTQGFIRSLHSL